jgi:hypothetical protein
MLDPALQQAETLLPTALADVCAALPDERAAARRLNHILTTAGAILQVNRHDGRWRIAVAGQHPLADAATALAVLVVTDGWRRLKQCTHCGRLRRPHQRRNPPRLHRPPRTSATLTYPRPAAYDVVRST